MKRERYDGPVWERRRPAPALRALLERRDTLIELDHGERPELVIGVPHHAPRGVAQIAKSRPEGGRVADENAVLYALMAYSALTARDLPCRLVVAAHATDHDPNKSADSPYCRAALREPHPRLLVECHGSSPRAPFELEVTAGHNARTRPLAFGERLAAALGPGHELAVQRRPGSAEATHFRDGRPEDAPARLRFPALRTHSLAAAAGRGCEALHLEAKPRFRTRGVRGLRLNRAGEHLGRQLGEALAAYAFAGRVAPSRNSGAPDRFQAK